MNNGIDLYKHEVHLERRLAQLEQQGVTRAYAKTIRAFVAQGAAEGLSASRLRKYVFMFTTLTRYSKLPLSRWDKDEIVRVVGRIERTHYADRTKRDFRVALKRLFKWLKGCDEGYPPEVSWIRTSARRHNAKLPEDLLTEDEVKRIVDAAETVRDKAFLFILYESGCRVGEIATLQLKHVSFDDYGARLTVMGKTGPRRVRLISGVPALAQWANTHPLRDERNAPLWVNLEGHRKHQAMSYSGLRAALMRAVRKAGIKKRVHPHLFRHSRATHLANHLTEAQMKEHFGWVQGSDMAAIYVHLSGRDVDEALLKLHGLRKDKEHKRQEKLKPRTCGRCRFVNSAEACYCSQCRMPLDLQTAMAAEDERRPADDLLSDLSRDPRVREALLRALEQLAASGVQLPVAAAPDEGNA